MKHKQFSILFNSKERQDFINNILLNIICSKIIDRIELSISIRNYEDFLEVFIRSANFMFANPSKSENFLISTYERRGKLIQVIHRIRFEKNKHYFNQRFYVQVSQPDIETMCYLRDLLNEFPKSVFKQYNPCINQLEIAHDFYTEDEYSRYALHEYLAKHLHLKFSRKGSAGKFKETSYRGKKKIIWAGAIGSRCYIKGIFGTDGLKEFCRLEIQLNRRYLRKNKITIDDLPLMPADLHVLRNFEILDDFSVKEIKYMTRTIMRNNGTFISYDTRKSFRFAIKEQLLRQEIYGGYFPDNYVSVPEQIERCNGIKQRYGLTLHPKKHCKRLFGLEDFIKGARNVQVLA